MQVQLLFFSVLRDITGHTQEHCTLPAETHTVADLLQQLYQRWPALKAWDKSLLVAMNQVYAKRTDLIIADSEIALMPPVQGG
jgi:molybdopterin converting factor subunit 1